MVSNVFFFQAEDGIRYLVRSRGLGDVYKRQLPDWGYLRDKSDHIVGIVITHGHEDHVGALPYLILSLIHI